MPRCHDILEEPITSAITADGLWKKLTCHALDVLVQNAPRLMFPADRIVQEATTTILDITNNDICTTNATLNNVKHAVTLSLITLVSDGTLLEYNIVRRVNGLTVTDPESVYGFRDCAVELNECSYNLEKILNPTAILNIIVGIC